MYKVDLTIFRWLNSLVGTNEFYDWLIIFSATYLFIALMVVIFLFYSFDNNIRRVRCVILHSLAAGVLSRYVFTEIIRFFYTRVRPFGVLDGVKSLIFHEPSGAMPSGHAAFSFAVTMAVYYYYPKTSILFFLAALAIGAGRVSAGVHWPSDILVGAAVGIFAAWLLEFLFKKLQNK